MQVIRDEEKGSVLLSAFGKEDFWRGGAAVRGMSYVRVLSDCYRQNVTGEAHWTHLAALTCWKLSSSVALFSLLKKWGEIFAETGYSYTEIITSFFLRQLRVENVFKEKG